MRTAPMDRAINSFLRGMPLESALVTSNSVVTRESCFVRSIGTFHAQNNIVSVQLIPRTSTGSSVYRLVNGGVGNSQITFKSWRYMPNGFGLSLAGSLGNIGNYGAQAIFIRTANIPWLRGLDRPSIEEVYARAATVAEVARVQNAA